MPLPQTPMNVSRIHEEEVFHFDCNRSLHCFTHCCRQLDLALTPYDVLRLKNDRQMHSHTFLDNYVIIEHDEEDAFPRYYLTMVDDGKASCIFVSTSGCLVYENRPSACRTYPLGRATIRQTDNRIEEAFVVLKEEHCKGFACNVSHTPRNYCREQGVDTYNRYNDELITLLQHDLIRSGMKLNRDQADLYTLALYDLDSFREKISSGVMNGYGTTPPVAKSTEDDLALLRYGIVLLKAALFSSSL